MGQVPAKRVSESLELMSSKPFNRICVVCIIVSILVYVRGASLAAYSNDWQSYAADAGRIFRFGLWTLGLGLILDQLRTGFLLVLERLPKQESGSQPPAGGQDRASESGA